MTHLGQILAGLRMKIVEPAVLLDISAEKGHACFEKSELIVEVRQLWSKAGLDKNVKKTATNMHCNLKLERADYKGRNAHVYTGCQHCSRHFHLQVH